MMARNLVRRVLQVAYPAIVFTIVFLIWSSSNLAEIAHYAPPPVNDGFSFFWNPTLSDAHTCSGKQESKFKLKQVCSAGGSASSVEQFSDRSSQTTNPTN